MVANSIHVAIVGSGFAGSLIANELSKKGYKVVILEAGPDVQPNFNTYMDSFYRASSKVPESPYPPAVFDSDGKFRDPGTVAAGRPSSPRRFEPNPPTASMSKDVTQHTGSIR